MPFSSKKKNTETQRLIEIIDQIMGKTYKAEDLVKTCESLKEDINIFMKMLNEQKQIDFVLVRDKMMGGTGKPQNPMTEKNFLSYNSYLRRAKLLYKNVERSEAVIENALKSALPTSKDDLRTWNVNLRIAYNEFEQIVNYYQNTMRKNLTLENTQKIKFLILEKAQTVFPGEDKVYIGMLKLLGFDAVYVENLGPEKYMFKFSDEVYHLTYTGYLLDGVKEGRGVLSHENLDIFYAGAFKNGEIYGVNIKLWHKHLTMFANLRHVHDKEDHDFADSITLMGDNDKKFESLSCDKYAGDVEIYYRNNKLRYQGKLSHGIKECEQGEEYYDNGRLRYKGAFKNNYYYGKDAVVYHSHIDIYKPMLSKSKNILLMGNFDENGLLQGRLTDGPDSRIFLIDPSYEGLAWWTNYKDGLFDTTEIRDSNDGDKILLNDPGIDCYYEGEYLMGLKHGFGKIQCRIPFNYAVFEGEWKYN